MNLDQARFNMVEQQIRPWDILDPKVLALFMSIPRHEFVAESQQKLAYSDLELPISADQSMWPPRVEGRLLQALDLNEEDSLLEVGTGSGYVTALCAAQVKQMTTVEIDPELQATARARLTHYNNIEFATGDASQNWPDQKQYDAILLTGAVPEITQAYKEKLTLGGRMAVISGETPAMQAMLVTRVTENEWENEILFETDLAYLINSEKAESFSL